jgi:hypothetical protein
MDAAIAGLATQEAETEQQLASVRALLQNQNQNQGQNQSQAVTAGAGGK